MTKLTWKANFSASALHAAQAIAADQRLTDPRLAESLAPAAGELNSILIEWLGGNSKRGWRLLVGMSVGIDVNRMLAEQWIRRLRTGGANEASRVARLAGAISDVEAAMTLFYPKLLEQLQLRGRPMQEQWLGYGVGLMAHLRRLTEEAWLVADADAILVHPVLGGGGQAFPTLNRFSIEAVLTNPLAELPEVVRIAWLVSQLQSDLPMFTEELGADRAEPVAALASLTAVLAAAEVLEISRCDEATIQLAIEHWQIAIPALDDVASVLLPWWETYLQTRPKWSIALRALDKMLIGQLA
ncbi:MAG: hypothetical protein SGI77_06320 [Pirellulaceae bacterium]|nr:hypothetical protein [Pirellulaceae bacterium]